MELLSKPTRFRAYQLGTEGSSFSYYDGSHFTLIEARLNVTNAKSIVDELKLCNKTSIDTLHITSWDNDHCNPDELKMIIEKLKPTFIEYPGYQPDSDDGKESRKTIESFEKSKVASPTLRKIDPTYIRALKNSTAFAYVNVLYHPQDTYEKENDNSIIQLFRTGSFAVASLGDVEAMQIQNMLMNSNIFCTEVDIMILAHHGSDKSITSDAFIKKVNPSVAIASSDYDDKYGHPKPVVKNCIIKNGGYFYTTKTGDIIAKSFGDHSKTYNVTNLVKDKSSSQNFYCKRYLRSIGK